MSFNYRIHSVDFGRTLHCCCADKRDWRDLRGTWRWNAIRKSWKLFNLHYLLQWKPCGVSLYRGLDFRSWPNGLFTWRHFHLYSLCRLNEVSINNCGLLLLSWRFMASKITDRYFSISLRDESLVIQLVFEIFYWIFYPGRISLANFLLNEPNLLI